MPPMATLIYSFTMDQRRIPGLERNEVDIYDQLTRLPKEDSIGMLNCGHRSGVHLMVVLGFSVRRFRVRHFSFRPFRFRPFVKCLGVSAEWPRHFVNCLRLKGLGSRYL